jgi:hypothetical protein
MGAKETLPLLINQAQLNGFNLERWFEIQLEREWPGQDKALAYLLLEHRYYALLFSHEFARYFWRTGAMIAFTVPSVTYSRVNGHGEVIEVTRKPFTRRTVKPDAWKYHIRQMAGAEDPLVYLRRFLPTSLPPKVGVIAVAMQAVKPNGSGLAQA